MQATTSQQAEELLAGDAKEPDLDRPSIRKPRRKGLELYPIGTKIYKLFWNDDIGEPEEYVGQVRGCDTHRKWFHVVYTDGDSEELNSKEVKDHLHPTPKRLWNAKINA